MGKHCDKTQYRIDCLQTVFYALHRLYSSYLYIENSSEAYTIKEKSKNIKTKIILKCDLKHFTTNIVTEQQSMQ